MSDTPGRGCGLWLTFRGWAEKACNWHDDAYTEGSSQQKAGITRERVDQNFEDQLAELSKRGTFQSGKKIQSALMGWFVRLPIVGRLYEGKVK